MKHLFSIHSPITFLAAYSVVQKLGLDKSNVIFISSRYEVPIDGFKVVNSFAEQYAGSFWTKLRYLNVPKHFDIYIKEITGGDKYIAYLDLIAYYQKIIATNPNCVGFHFIEEGNSSYMTYDDLDDLTWENFLRGMDFRVNSYFSKAFLNSLLRILRGYNLRLISIPYHYAAYANFKHLKFFCFSDNAFYNAPNEKKEILTITPDDPNMLKLATSLQLRNEVIWIDGSSSIYTGLPDRYYHHAIDLAVNKLTEEGILSEKVWVKLRPGMTNFTESYLFNTLSSKGFDVKVLPDNIVIESLFIVSSNCTVVGNLSSALEYAHVFGHFACSIYSMFEEQPSTFFDKIDGFWKNVRKL